MNVLRDVRLSLLCLFWYVFCVYAYAHTRTLNDEHESIFYIRRGLRVVGFDIKAMREPQVVELARASSTLFCCV